MNYSQLAVSRVSAADYAVAVDATDRTMNALRVAAVCVLAGTVLSFLQTLMAEAMLRGMTSSNGSPWESGHCINLQVTSRPGERTHLKPGTAFDIEAWPRVKSDGSPRKARSRRC
jgi:hypothetical protein